MEKVMEHSKDSIAKSLRFEKGISRACCNPLCKAEFTPVRKDQRFCGPKCKENFFKVKYTLLVLAPYFDADLEEK